MFVEYCENRQNPLMPMVGQGLKWKSHELIPLPIGRGSAAKTLHLLNSVDVLIMDQ